MELKEAIEYALTWAKKARRMEGKTRKSGYTFMASDYGNEAEVLETLVQAIKRKECNDQLEGTTGQ